MDFSTALLPSPSANCCKVASIKQRLRTTYRLQLVFLNLIYERIQLDMPHSDSEPTSKPVQPQVRYLSPLSDISRDPKANR